MCASKVNFLLFVIFSLITMFSACSSSNNDVQSEKITVSGAVLENDNDFSNLDFNIDFPDDWVFAGKTDDEITVFSPESFSSESYASVTVISYPAIDLTAVDKDLFISEYSELFGIENCDITDYIKEEINGINALHIKAEPVISKKNEEESSKIEFYFFIAAKTYAVVYKETGNVDYSEVFNQIAQSFTVVSK